MNNLEERFNQIVNDVLDKWLGFQPTPDEWRLEADDILARMKADGLMIAEAPKVTKFTGNMQELADTLCRDEHDDE